MSKTLKAKLASQDENLVVSALIEVEEQNLFHLLSAVLPLTQSANPNIKKMAGQAAFSLVQRALLEESVPLDEKVKIMLQRILLQLEPDLLKKIASRLDAGDFDARIEALQLLKALGNNKMAAEVLRICLKDTDQRIRATAVVSLAASGTQKDMSLLMAYLRDKDDRVRANTIQALEGMGNKNLVAVLLRFRRDTSNRVRANVLKALWNYGFTEIYPDIEEMLRDPEPRMRASAVWLIGEIGQNQPPLVGLLNRALDDTGELVQNTLVRTINKLGDESLEKNFSHILSLEKMRQVKKSIIARSRITVTHEPHAHYHVLVLAGELSTFTIIKLKFELEELIKQKQFFIALNGAGLTFVDSSGVGLLVNFNLLLKKNRGNLLLYNLGDDVFELLQTMGIPSLIDIVQQADEAGEILGKKK